MPDAVGIHKRLFGKVAGGVHLVFDFHLAEAEVGLFLKLFTTEAGTGIIHAHYDHTVLRQHLMPHGGGAKAVGHLLRAGTAVVAKQDGVLFIGVKIGGLQHPTVEGVALAIGYTDELHLAHGVFGQ